MSMKTFLLLLLTLLSTSQCYARIQDDSKRWKVETSWEKKAVDRVPEDDRPWPLWIPKRREKTVIMRLSYGGGNKKRRVLESKEEGHDEEHEEEELSVEVLYEEIYDTIIFLTVAWLLGHVASLLGMPTLVGEIVTGFLLGPPLADYVPFPEAMVLIGEIGLIGLLLEAGIEMDIGQLKETGLRAFAMAGTGAVIPLGVGIGLAVASGSSVRAAIAVGAAFAPTSLGVASNALNAGCVANTPVGQLIVAACVVDDIVGLILLSMLEVLVDEDAAPWEYAIPIISSFGYLAVLGLSGLTWLPRVIEKHILSRFPEERREIAAFAMMMMLLLAYLPLLNYSRSSYLTGAFLAGLTFSQIHSIHGTFVRETSSLMTWLLRIFFAASIGFQVPITMFGDPYILQWGFAFYVCVLAKLPLGIFVPQFEKKETTPENFPYNPYVRDVIYVSVAMTCRGEFSFVIAAFALGEGLFTPELYSAIVFAVLLSSITSPFVLLSIIKYYNRLSEAYLAQSLLEPEEGKDGMSSLFLSIQIRSPNQWGLQETIGSVVQRLELSVVDHRSWHPRGANSTVITELYVEDNEVRVPLQKLEEFDKPIEDEAEASMRSAKALVDKRCEEIKESIGQVLGHADETRITVTWWQPHAISSRRDSVAAFAELEDTIRERIKSEANDEINAHYITAEPTTFANSLRRRRDRMITPKVGNDMWTKDDIAQKAAAADEFQPLAAAADTRGRYRYGRRRKVVSDVSGFVLLETAPTPEQHLAGFVRRENPEVTPSEGFARFHPGRMHATEEDIEEMTERNVRVRTKSDLSGFQLRRRLSGKIRTQKHVKSQSDLTGLSLKKTNSGNIKAASSSPIVIEESTEEQQRPAEEP